MRPGGKSNHDLARAYVEAGKKALIVVGSERRAAEVREMVPGARVGVAGERNPLLNIPSLVIWDDDAPQQ